MNLHQIASSAIGAVNPFITGTVTPAAAYTTGADFVQVPGYGTPITAQMQVQALSTRDLQHMDSLNIQGNFRKVWLNGNWNGVIRPEGKGGDLVTFLGQNWLVVSVLEQWPDWTSVAVALQQ
jgi:hypothetical protein